MVEIKERDDIKDVLKKNRSIILYGKDDCIHCTIVHKCVEELEEKYPLISFYHTNDKSIAEKHNVTAFPTIVFFENGNEQGRLVGSSKITLLKEILNLWFYKK